MHVLDQFGADGGLLLMGVLLLAGLGLPLPVTPLLLVAGALARAGKMNLAMAVALPPVCLLVGDLLWFVLGRYFGQGILRTVCRVTLERDTCIRKTQDTFDRYGLRTMLVARFVPGLSTLAPPMAGASNHSLAQFMAYNSVGTSFYTILYGTIGYCCARQLDVILHFLGGAGTRLTVVLGCALAAYVIYKFLARVWLIRKSEELAIAASDLHKKQAADPELLIFDLRGPMDLAKTPFAIPGARRLRESQLLEEVSKMPWHTPMVLFCACPNQASSTRVALALRKQGFKNVWPLRDGLDGWRAAGLAVEPVVMAAPAT